MIIVKRLFTLMEVLIAMVLTVLVLMTLTFFYQQVVVIGTDIDQMKEQGFYTRYVENRLADVLPKAVSEKDKDFAFFSIGDEGITKIGSQSLIFTFDNGISLDKPTSNHVVGRLFVDPEGRLTLAYWPVPKQWDKTELPPMKKEILLEGVEAMEMAYFIAPEIEPEKETKDENKKEENKKGEKSPAPAKKENEKKEPEAKPADVAAETPVPEPKGAWREQPWLKEFKQLPLLVKISLQTKDNKEKMVFIFPLSNNKAHIIYE